MKLKNVSHYAIYDQKFDNWKPEVLDRWTYDDFVRDPQYKKKWISITSRRITSRRTPYIWASVVFQLSCCGNLT